jgi:hypothetical protein
MSDARREHQSETDHKLLTTNYQLLHRNGERVPQKIIDKRHDMALFKSSNVSVSHHRHRDY